MQSERENKIIEIIQNHQGISSKEVFQVLNSAISYATVKRVLMKLQEDNYIISEGKGKATKYLLSPVYKILKPVDMEAYYTKEIDERQINTGFNFDIIPTTLANFSVFTEKESKRLEELHAFYKSNVAQLSENEFNKELERLAIDLSWKSSQIEGNTYSLLETEKLLKEKQTASGKTKEEAVMLLNHKEALDFIMDSKDYLNPLTLAKIENIHSILVKELAIERNLRKRRVGISGTNYRPLDNEFQISEALKNTCDVINNKKFVFEKALLALVLISYIQPFMDGNKRTARIVSNAILIHENYCPLSFRTVDSIEYKKAILLFYEQNNISNFKELFIDQYEFAVNTYF